MILGKLQSFSVLNYLSFLTEVSTIHTVFGPGAQHSDWLFLNLPSDHRVSLVPDCLRTKLLRYYWFHSPRCTSHPAVHSLCSCKCVALNPPHLFHSFLNHPPCPSTAHSFFSVTTSLFCFCYICSFACFLYSKYKWNHVVFGFLCFIHFTQHNTL